MPPEDRDPTDNAWAFTQAAGTGVKEGAVGMAEGLWSVAKGGYHLATDPAAREKAWDITKKLADRAENYGAEAVDDPAKPFRDARNEVLAIKGQYDAAHDQAAAEGKLAEFYGKGIGRGAFEIGTLAVGVGEVGAIGKAGEMGELASDAAKVSRAAGDVGEAVNAERKAAEVLENPALRKAEEPLSAVKKCPLEGIAMKDAKVISAEEANAAFPEAYGTVYTPGTEVTQFTTTEPLQMTRVHMGDNPTGAFMVRSDEIAGMSPAQIQAHLNLPETPSFVQTVDLPAGTRMQVGSIGPQEKFGFSNPGGTQFQSLDRLPESAFGPGSSIP